MHIYYETFAEALTALPWLVRRTGHEEDSRNGPVITLREPVIISTTDTSKKVLLCPKRRANPFLFLLDGLSIFSSVKSVRPFADIVSRFIDYSDDGFTLRGHYGSRMQSYYRSAIHMLRKDPKNRRVVINIWDNDRDLDVKSKDIPCNVMVIPRIVYDRLDLTVFNRSNDLFWGMLGANCVQFSFLQEFLAREIGVPVGRLHQISTNLHIYRHMGPGTGNLEFPKIQGEYPPVIPLDTADLLFQTDELFASLAGGVIPSSSPNVFIETVVLPMLRTRKFKSLEELNGWPDCDWFHAARMYIK